MVFYQIEGKLECLAGKFNFKTDDISSGDVSTLLKYEGDGIKHNIDCIIKGKEENGLIKRTVSKKHSFGKEVKELFPFCYKGNDNEIPEDYDKRLIQLINESNKFNLGADQQGGMVPIAEIFRQDVLSEAEIKILSKENALFMASLSKSERFLKSIRPLGVPINKYSKFRDAYDHLEARAWRIDLIIKEYVYLSSLYKTDSAKQMAGN